MSGQEDFNQVIAAASAAHSASPAAAPSASDPTTAAAAVSTNGEVTNSSTISSLADLKNKAPKIYQFMMLSLAQNMCIQMQESQDRLTQIWRQMGGDPGDGGLF